MDASLGEQKIKSYWNRPGGKLGTVVGLGALAAMGYWAFPIMTKIVWNTLNFGIGLTCLAAFIFIITNRKFRMALTYMWEILMKYTFGLVFTWDPFIIAEDDIKDMKNQREKARSQAVEVDTQKEATTMKLKEKTDEINRLMTKARVAQKNNMSSDLALISDQIQGYKDYIEQLTPMLANLTRISTFLTKFDESAGRTIERAETQLELKKDLYREVTAGNKAISTALRFFKGDPEKKLLVQQSMDAFRLDVASKLANMKKAMSLSSDYMRSIDLDKATSEEQGLKMIESMDSDKAFSLDLPTDASTISSAPGKIDTQFYDNLLKS
jgi:hypothetical protein